MTHAGYVEPARTYTSSVVLFVVLLAGSLIDLIALGGSVVHALGWAVAALLVVGIDALSVHATRLHRSIVVSPDEVRVGDDAVPRKEIIRVRLDAGENVPVLGRRPGVGRPRGTEGLTLELTGGRAVVLATRNPQRLAEALGAKDLAHEVRCADPAELELLPEIDRRAESQFRLAGMELPSILFPVDELRESEAVFVAGRPPVGFVQINELDGVAHVEELAVLPSHMRQGIGSALLDAACDWARSAGYPAVTLTTYSDVAWNAPFYAARGFLELTELLPGLAGVRAWERDIGLNAVGRRIAMRREL